MKAEILPLPSLPYCPPTTTQRLTIGLPNELFSASHLLWSGGLAECHRFQERQTLCCEARLSAAPPDVNPRDGNSQVQGNASEPSANEFLGGPLCTGDGTGKERSWSGS